MANSDRVRLIEAHEPQWTSAWIWLAFAAAFFLVAALLLWTLLAEAWWLAVPLVLLLGHLMHAHLVAFHEAAHQTLCPNRWVNDGMGIFIGNLGFMGLSLYRAAHHFHHAFLATERDVELWPFVVPGTPRWARRLAAAAELTFGLFYTPFLFLRTFLRRGSPIQDPAVRRRVWVELAQMALMWAVVVAATAWWGGWKYLLVIYVVPAMLAGNMQSLRKYIEHMGLSGSTVLGATRSVVPAGPVGRLVAFSLFNVSYHGVHHQFAKMPFGAMPEFSPVLTPTGADEVPPYSSYRRALWAMLHSLSDPRVGPQWNDVKARNTSPDTVRDGQVRDMMDGTLLSQPATEGAG
jgi:fatty acid desaturase